MRSSTIPHPNFPEIVLPALRASELLLLCSEGLDLDEARLRVLLELSRDALIGDALALLAHAQSAAAQYMARDAQERLSIAELSFPAHALWILAQMRASAHFPEVVDFLAAKAEVLDFWLGAALPQGLWQVIYHLGQKQLPALHALARSTTSVRIRREVVLAVGQIGWHSPLRRGEVRDWIAGILAEIASQKAVSEADRQLAALLVIEVSQLRFPALLPQIEALYAQARIDSGIAGSYADIVREVEGLINSHAKAKKHSIFSFYAHARQTWKVYRDAPESGFSADTSAILDLGPTRKPRKKHQQPLNSFDPRKQPPRKNKKTGRNAPCPCGSGKKFKHCHGK